MKPESKPINSDYLLTVLENMTDVLMLFNVEHSPVLQYRVAYMNDAAFKHLMIREDAVGLLLTDVLRPAYSAVITAYYNEVMTSGQAVSWSKQYDNNGPQLITLYLRTKLIPIKNALGDVIQILSITNDETVTVSLQNALAHTELQSHAYVEATGQMVMITDDDFQIISMAEELRRALSLKPHESLRTNPLFASIVAEIKHGRKKASIVYRHTTYKVDIRFAPTSKMYVCVCIIA
jgi:hypothetical protein